MTHTVHSRSAISPLLLHYAYKRTDIQPLILDIPHCAVAVALDFHLISTWDWTPSEARRGLFLLILVARACCKKLLHGQALADANLRDKASCE